MAFNAVAIIYASFIMGAWLPRLNGIGRWCFEFWPAVAILYMAVAGTAISFPLYFWLLEHMPARQVALIGYGTPVLAVFLGVLFLDETLTVRTLLGSALVVIGVAVASHSPRRR